MTATPDLQAILAKMQAGKAGEPASAGSSIVPIAGLQASIQAELNGRLMAAQAEFEANVQAAITEVQQIQDSDLCTVRLSIGEEATFRRLPDGSTEDLVNWLVTHGWAPVGVEAA